ncbi:MAG: hypothetical protein C5B50_15815 [Verrucomicrobia bacterium]|nr:MAG: hypothetical protein C5B50_15815 [Verrucomicrobiota bacterium]
MRVSRVITFLVLLMVCLVGLFFLGPSLTEYSRFRGKSTAYYSALTQAFDKVLIEHPVGTNRFVELSVTDPSLPKVIRDLQPLKIKLQPQRCWILHGGSIEFGISWEQDESRTNVWTLSTACESDVRIVYVASR